MPKPTKTRRKRVPATAPKRTSKRRPSKAVSWRSRLDALLDQLDAATAADDDARYIAVLQRIGLTAGLAARHRQRTA